MEKCWKQREISRRAVRGAVKHMRNIQEIDRELERARQKMERSRKLDVILQDLKEQSVRRRQAEEEARAVLEKEQSSIAHSAAPSISKIERGRDGSVIKAS